MAGRRKCVGRRQIAAVIAERFKLPFDAALGCTDTVFICVMEALGSGESVTISNFGSFTIRHHNARIKHDPRTMAEVHVPDKNVIRFKPSRMLNATINGE